MASQATSAALTGLTAAQNAVGIIGGNIANEDTDGYKSFSQLLGANAAADGMSSTGVTSYTRLNADVQGNMRNTRTSTDIAIEGNGMFVVTDPNVTAAGTSTYFTKNGSFRTNENGDLSLPSGHVLMAWQLDDSGSLPPGASTINSLTPVGIKQLVSQATATSNVTFAVNLNSTQQLVGGGQVTLDISNTGTKSSPNNAFVKSTDILYPNQTNSLAVGEGITVTVPILQSNGMTLNTPTNFTYGGFSQTNTFTDAIGGPLTAGTATDILTITVGTNTANITRGAATTNLGILENIVNQINQTYGTFLTARIVDNGTTSSVLIAPLNANLGMSFSGTGTLQTELGLTTNTIAGTNRFASLQNLTDALNAINGVKATVGSGINASITLNSENSMNISNYRPLGAGSDFISEFNINSGSQFDANTGYIKSSYNPYDINNNMANGAFTPAYKKDIVVYDAMGNAYNFIVAFLKTDANTWATEIYSLDKTVINNGRIDGLVQAGSILFDNKGKLQSYLEPVQNTIGATSISNPASLLNATNGQVMTIASGSTTHTFTYNDTNITSGTINGAGGTLVGIPTDTLTITIGSTAYTFTRGAGANDLDVLTNIANQINQTTGPTALVATINNLGAGNFSLTINPVDVTQSVNITTSPLGTSLGITAANNISADATRFKTLYELAERINETSTSTDPLEATVFLNNAGSYQIKIEPANPSSLMTFGGTSGVISSPLGVGATTTIAAALGVENTSSAKALTPLGQAVTINWSNSIQAAPNTITFDFGIAGNDNSISQINQVFIERNIVADGTVTGQLSGLSIDKQGFVVASFTNGKVRNIYKLALANFTNQNGLTAVSSTLFSASQNSGPLNLLEAGTNGAGTVLSGTIEGSNVEIANELSNLIQAQTWYQASAKVINIDNSLFDELIHRTYA